MTPFEHQLIELVQDRVETDALATLDSALVEDLGLDSLARTELWVSLEELYQCKIPESEAEQLTTVRQIADYLRGQGLVAD
jgi:acyl carrier protein